mmetsp:Transcript_26285/g.36629  ORF Transcript_26285/g.36629 Transcript_26285/m.36629 type:complete len:240 (+) Transcript_26285:1413-2132(+)
MSSASTRFSGWSLSSRLTKSLRSSFSDTLRLWNFWAVSRKLLTASINSLSFSSPFLARSLRSSNRLSAISVRIPSVIFEFALIPSCLITSSGIRSSFSVITVREVVSSSLSLAFLLRSSISFSLSNSVSSGPNQPLSRSRVDLAFVLLSVSLASGLELPVTLVSAPPSIPSKAERESLPEDGLYPEGLLTTVVSSALRFTPRRICGRWRRLSANRTLPPGLAKRLVRLVRAFKSIGRAS